MTKRTAGHTIDNKIHSLALLTNLGIYGVALPVMAEDQTDSVAVPYEGTIVATAARQNLQAPGVPTITTDEIRENLPARDVPETIRIMPGISLTGNSTNGQRGNNRQTDIRGMGSENTLILINGKPVTSCNSVRQGWCGRRDTRGDTAWVAPKMIERIEVLRGPTVACYSNGAVGGVANIITKKGGDEWHGSWSTYFNASEYKEEGSAKRTNFSLNGSLDGNFNFCLNGNLDKTQADARNINDGHQSARTGSCTGTVPASREGIKNKDINGLLRWDLAPMQSLESEVGYNRQDNLYAGDTQNANNSNKTNGLVEKYCGKEASRMYRQNYALTWNSGWDNGITTSNWAQYEHTHNLRLSEGLAGGLEELFDSNQFIDTDLADVALYSEIGIPFDLLANQNLTLGTEWSQQRTRDMSSNTQTFMGGNIPGASNTDHSPYSQAEIFSLFVENNMELIDNTMLTLGLRFDHYNIVGDSWSPPLSPSQGLGGDFTLKMGIARTYKTPSLYQTNPDYILHSKGQDCYATGPTAGIGCYMMGSDDLKAETSINKEIDLEFKRDSWLASVTWFYNNYRNKIEMGTVPLSRTSTTQKNSITGKETTIYTGIHQWESVPKAVVEGLGETLNIPVNETVTWINSVTYIL